jgi:DNA-binding NtrC family response regulator
MQDQRPTRVFVVDDERLIAETLSLILSRNGFSASFFVDPVAALQASRFDTPDLVISDVMMPQMSGVDFAIQVTALCPACKILLFSGQAGTVDMLHAAREQGYDFHLLAKPVHPADLLRKIRAHTFAHRCEPAHVCPAA